MKKKEKKKKKEEHKSQIEIHKFGEKLAEFTR